MSGYNLPALICFILCLNGVTIQAQYYYTDLLGARQLEQRQITYKRTGVQKAEGVGILPNGTKQTDFSEVILVAATGDTTSLVRNQGQTTTRIRWIFDQTGKPLSQWEQTDGLSSITVYEWDTKNRLRQVLNTVTDSLTTFAQQEVHVWSYRSDGMPNRMWRIVTKEDRSIDSTEYRFSTDSAGLTTEERGFRNGRELDAIYYYYNDQGLMTDIVRFNEKWKRLLPDQLFEYNEAGSLLQRMQLTGSRDIAYLIWRYGYSSEGLLIEEALFNNKKQHTGSILYTYSR